MNTVNVVKDRVIQAKSLHGAIAAVTIGLMLTLMTQIFISAYNDPEAIWLHVPEILLITGAGMVSYAVIRFLDILYLRLEKDWGITELKEARKIKQFGSTSDKPVA